MLPSGGARSHGTSLPHPEPGWGRRPGVIRDGHYRVRAESQIEHDPIVIPGDRTPVPATLGLLQSVDVIQDDAPTKNDSLVSQF